MNLAEDLRKVVKGEVFDDEKTLDAYSRDASIFKVRPKLVVFPKDAQDISNLVRYIALNKEKDPTLSVTVRAAGSDMSGGPLNDSIIADVTKYLNRIGEVKPDNTSVQPGAFYRDFEKNTLKKGLILPCYTASKNLCALGGMIGNNAGGEKTLRYGKMENFVVESKWIFSDGNEYLIKRGAIDNQYSKEIYKLIKENEDLIKSAKPNVSKNSAGFYLWNIFDNETFDLNKLLVGSQGTLGIMTEATVSLVPVKTHHDLIAIFFKSWDDMPAVVNTLLPFDPESLETFDKDTIKLGIRFMPEIAKKAGSNIFSFAAKFLPEAVIGIEMGGLPELVVLAEIAEGSIEEVKRKTRAITESLKVFKVRYRVVEKDSEEEKFWIVRRESFNLLREHVKNKRTVPFIDDFCIPAEKIPEFLPQAKKILQDYNIDINIAGHAGNGNFHIIPLMDLKDERERKKLILVANQFYDLVAKYHGSITGEHNDGIVRTPYLNKMYSPEILNLFKKVKQIFDPQNIFNPNKKVGGTLEYLENHLDSG